MASSHLLLLLATTVAGISGMVLTRTKRQLQPDIGGIRPDQIAGVTIGDITDPNIIAAILASLSNPPGGTITIDNTGTQQGFLPGHGLRPCKRPRPSRNRPIFIQPIFIPIPVGPGVLGGPIGNSAFNQTQMFNNNNALLAQLQQLQQLQMQSSFNGLLNFNRRKGSGDEQGDTEGDGTTEYDETEQSASETTTKSPGIIVPEPAQTESTIELKTNLPIEPVVGTTTTEMPMTTEFRPLTPPRMAFNRMG